ncbi:hypothetical protein GKA01_12140 [Gluconobacter kanchanaburiensis NBRC 103587]|uniref:Uncharacterized protein n=1 Tax=Gluconobacter kanchanaburiensis NBRC 103587 TaxID=1307948 RepID=A0A511BDY7_9PROT|nr:hypothetical protein AA103587_2047 [Gluconobacter kanchanaburiensis NBRC 103587]GEK96017.1 hypothetical protein GKA01_12140 [Gluconobacter kanchanaburiensis NBRC 103587]
MRPFFHQIGRDQIDENTFGRKRQTHGCQGGPDPLPCFADRLVRKPYDEKGRKPA